MIKQRYFIELPQLSGEQAYLLTFVLEEAVKTIWKAHGDAMADFQGRVFPDVPSPYGSTTDCDCSESDPDSPF